MNQNFSYLVPAVTAFQKDGSLDRKANQAVWDYLIQSGVDGIVLLGSTGEFFSLSPEQKRLVIDWASETISNRTRLLVGTGGMDVSETIELTRYAAEHGADGALVISPYYFSLSDQSIEAFYSRIADQSGIPIYLYNFPDRTGYDLNLEVTLRLLRRHPGIAGYKDSTSHMAHTRDLIRGIHSEFPAFEIYSGFDDNFAHTILSGGNGAIGALANLCPELTSSFCRSIKSGDMAQAAENQEKIDRLMKLYTYDVPFLSAIKYAMKLRGVPIQEYSTFPFLPLRQEVKTQLEHLLRQENLI